jgi:hypothetical protein
MAVSKIHKQIIKNITVNHGTIAANATSTVEHRDSDVKSTSLICGIACSGAYNSNISVWSFYTTDGILVSRIRNDGTNTATNITVLYRVVL